MSEDKKTRVEIAVSEITGVDGSKFFRAIASAHDKKTDIRRVMQVTESAAIKSAIHWVKEYVRRDNPGREFHFLVSEKPSKPERPAKVTNGMADVLPNRLKDPSAFADNEQYKN